jgi:hypothetical protein
VPHCIYENAGTLLRVQYSMVDGTVPTIESVRVLDSRYHPCGPELLPFFTQLVLMHTAEEGEALMSVLAGEIYDANVRI